MTSARFFSILAIAHCLAMPTIAISSSIAPAKADTAAAWRALSDGAIVLFRHAEAPGSGDPKSFKLGDCTTQRNLSPDGRTQSRRIGVAFRTRKIPVARVLTSQWCRCVDTAELAFPGQVVPEPAFNSFFRNFEREAEQTKQARAVLAAWTGPGTLVVVTHMVNITALTGVDPDEGEGVVLRVVGGKLQQIGRIVP